MRLPLSRQLVPHSDYGSSLAPRYVLYVLIDNLRGCYKQLVAGLYTSKVFVENDHLAFLSALSCSAADFAIGFSLFD